MITTEQEERHRQGWKQEEVCGGVGVVAGWAGKRQQREDNVQNIKWQQKKEKEEEMLLERKVEAQKRRGDAGFLSAEGGVTAQHMYTTSLKKHQ